MAGSLARAVSVTMQILRPPIQGALTRFRSAIVFLRTEEMMGRLNRRVNSDPRHARLDGAHRPATGSVAATKEGARPEISVITPFSVDTLSRYLGPGTFPRERDHGGDGWAVQ